ncbi:hypothetical protein LMG9673_03018 [Ralstonia pseudosolanacearum]|nr:hypothetical protein LMG9673_03018 [Ralstonia pseudosolanacearum]
MPAAGLRDGGVGLSAVDAGHRLWLTVAGATVFASR